MRVLLVAALCASVIPAHADGLGDCYGELESRGVAFRKAKKSGIALGVELTALDGIAITPPSETEGLVIDCSLAVSLHEVGRYLRALGIDRMTVSSGYSRRNVRGTNHPSKHSYGLAVDVAGFSGKDVGSVRVDRDYEQGLGDAVDCIGAPLTQGGALLKILQCQLVRSGLFHLVLSPDYDDAHHDHFHLEALPWKERSSLRASTPAIH